MEAIVVLVVVVSSVWVFMDARAIGAGKDNSTGFLSMGPTGWAFSCLLLWIVSFPLYLMQRSKIKNVSQGGLQTVEDIKEVKQGGITVVAKYIAVGWTIFCAIGVIVGLLEIGDLAPSVNEYEAAGYAIGATIGLGMWFGAWVLVAIPATIVYLVTRKNVASVTLTNEKSSSNASMKKCPYCAETIQGEAVFCRFCHRELSKKNADHPKEKTEKPKKDSVKMANEYFENEDYKSAVISYSEAINENPSGQLYYRRAAAYSKLRAKEKMMNDLKTASNYGNPAAKRALLKMGNN